MFTGERGSEQGEVSCVEWVEACVASPVVGDWPAQGIECGDAFAFQWGGSERVEVAVVGRDPDLEVAPQITDPFAHWAPPPLAPARRLVRDEAGDPELARI